MGQQMPMIRSFLLFAGILGAAGTACTSAAASSPQAGMDKADSVDPRVEKPEAAVLSAAPLSGCEATNVVVSLAGPPTSVVSRAQAERAAALVGVRGPATIATLARVTVGTTVDLRIKVGTPGIVPAVSASDVMTDLRGRPIKDRAAWVLVFANQEIPVPVGPGNRGAITRPRYVTAAATIIDAATGEFIHGWGCALRFVQP